MNPLFLAGSKSLRGKITEYDPYKDVLGRNILPVGCEFSIAQWASQWSAAFAMYRRNILPANADDFATTHGWAAYSSAVVGAYKNNILPAGANDFGTNHGWSAQNGCSVSVLKRNMLPTGADDFSTGGWATAYGEGVTITDYPINIPGIGDVIAKRIRGNGLGTQVYKYRSPQMTTVNPHTFTVSVWGMVLSGNAKVVHDGDSGAATLTGSMTRVSSTAINLDWGGGNMFFKTNAPTDCLDIVVYGPMINWGSTMDDYVPPQTGYPDPDGGNTAFRVVVTGVVSNYRYVCGTGAALLGPAYSHQIQIKSLNGKPVKLGDNKGGASLSYTDDQWHVLKVENTVYSSASAANCWLLAVNENDALDFLAYHPMVNIGATCDSYVPPQQGYPDPDGGNNAVRIVTLGGTSTAKYYCASGLTSLVGPGYSQGIRVKPLNGIGVRFGNWLGAGAVYTDNAWGSLVYENSIFGTAGALQVVVYAPNIADNLDFLAYQPRMNVGATCDSYVPPQQGYPDSDGGNSAVRIITVGGTARVKTGIMSPQINGMRYYLSVRVKALSGKIQTANPQSSVEYGPLYTADGNWHDLDFTYLATTTGSSYFCRLCTETIADNLDVLFYKPRGSFWNQIPYTPAQGYPQAVLDRSSRGNNGQLGSAAGSDTSDPGWASNSLNFAGDDYVMCGRPAASETSQPWCAYVVAYVTSSTNADTLIAKANGGSSAAGNTGFFLIKDNVVSPAAFGFSMFDSAGNINTLWSDAVQAGWHVFFIGWDGAKKYLKIDGVLKSNNQATYAANVTNTLILGRHSHVANGFFTGQQAYVSFCEGFHGVGEERRNYTRIKSIMAGRGITL